MKTKTFDFGPAALAVGGILGLAFLLWLRLYQPPNTVDDAYITFRYARNLATGAGLVYNAGERVLGTTTPAYAVLLAVLSRASGFYDYPRLALIVNALCDAVTFLLLLRLTTRLTSASWLGLCAAWLFAIDGRVLDWSTGGMETSFNVLVIVLTLMLFFEDRRAWAALTAGLAVLIRPDGAMLAAAIFLGWGWPALLKPRQWPWKEAGLFLLIVLPWLIFAALFYGTPIPQSVLAKSVVYRLPPLVGFRAFLVQFRTVFPFSLPPLREGQSLARQIAQALLPIGLCLLGLMTLLKRQPRAWVIGAYIALFIAFFSAGNPLWLGWYETPMMPLYQMLILAAALWAGQFAIRNSQFSIPNSPFAIPNSQSLIRHSFSLLALGLMALPQLSRLNLLPWETPHQAPFVLNATFNKQREADYRLVAEMLAPAAQSRRRLAIPEIGALGYYYPGALFDTTGLVSPAIHNYFPIPLEIPIEIYSVPRQMMFDVRPDLFVTFDSFIQATIPLDDPEFLALYRPTLGLTSHAAFGIQRLMTYRRNDLPVEVALPPEVTPVNAHFGPDYVRLAGYEMLSTADADNRFIDAVLFWQGRNAPIERDLLVRVQLVNAAGAVAYEILRQPGEGLFPSQTWTPGFWLVDRYPLIRPTPEAGPYTIRVTVFAADADAPLPALAADGAALPEATFTFPAGHPPPAP